MTDRERKILGTFKINEVIDEIGVDMILNHVPESDIMSHYDLDDLLDECSFQPDIANYLKENGFDFYEYLKNSDEEDSEGKYLSDEELLAMLCRRHKPNGVLMKRDIAEITNGIIEDIIDKCY